MYHFPIKWFSSGLTEPADYKVICWQIFNFIPSWPADYKVICWQIFNFIPSWIMTTRQASSQTHFLGCYFLNAICVWLRSFFNHQSTLPLLMLDGLMSHLDASLTNLYAPAPASFLWLLVCFFAADLCSFILSLRLALRASRAASLRRRGLFRLSIWNTRG